MARRHTALNSDAAFSQADYDEIGHELGSHALVVDAKLTEFADQLAGKDPILRAHLRRVERGDRSSSR